MIISTDILLTQSVLELLNYIAPAASSSITHALYRNYYSVFVETWTQANILAVRVPF